MKSKLEIVINKKDNKKISYKIIGEEENKYLLTGINYRIRIKVDKKDVEKATADILSKEKTKNDAYFIKQNYCLNLFIPIFK